MPAGILFSFGLFTLICYTYPLHWISLTNSLFQFIKLGWNFIGSWSLLSCLQLMLINLLKMPHHAGIYFSLSLFFLISVFILRIFFFLKMKTLFFSFLIEYELFIIIFFLLLQLTILSRLKQQVCVSGWLVLFSWHLEFNWFHFLPTSCLRLAVY